MFPVLSAQVSALEMVMPQEEEGTENTFLPSAACSWTTSTTCISFPDMAPLVSWAWLDYGPKFN